MKKKECERKENVENETIVETNLTYKDAADITSKYFPAYLSIH